MIIMPHFTAYQRGMGFMLILTLASLAVSWVVVFTIPNLITRSRTNGLDRIRVSRRRDLLLLVHRVPHGEAVQSMNLLRLLHDLQTTPVIDAEREVKIVVMGKDGEPAHNLSIIRIGQVAEWTDTPDGRRQLQYKMALVVGPLTDE